MPDMVETYAGTGAQPWWAGISPTARKMVMLEGDTVPWDEIAVAAELNWAVTKQPLLVAGGHPRTVPHYRVVQRDTDGAIFGVVKDTYHLFQNHEGGEFAQALLGASDGYLVGFVTGGSLFGGAQVWGLAKVDKTIHVRGDGSPLMDYVLVTWGHDGRHGLVAADTMIRVVCNNTLTAAIAGAKDKITIRHTVNMGARVEEAKRALDIHRTYVDRLEVVLNDLTRRPMTLSEVTDFTVALLPANPDVERAYKTEAERAAILGLYSHSPNLDGMDHTAYRAYQAVTEYADHGRTFRGTAKGGPAEDRRAASIIEGTSFDMKSRALALLVKA